ncbi:RDD family protein [Mycoplasmopsis ciconiae]|uniref:RDD family protein n=1 Tax=Mycoplasmopsis ciconiae TaxID=561067 RepID=A0ABU7MLW0_9BACT|nr:RDD family protein [Mycoplasmopsis ciconiae]
MYKYQNTSFWRRITANLIDSLLTFGFILLMYFLFINQKVANNTLTKGYYLGFFIINITWLLFYYLLWAWILKGSTLGYLLMRIKIVKSNSDDITLKSLLKRQSFALVCVIVPFLILMSFFNQEALEIIPNLNNQITKNSIAKISENFTKTQQILYSLSSTLFAIFIISTFANYLFIIFSKRKLGLFDLISDTRSVNIKQVFVDEIKEYQLMPILVNLKKIHVIKKGEE